MWHRFDEPLRDAVIAALRNAAMNGRATATPEDFASAAADRDVAPGAPPVNAISPDSLAIFEAAYERALRAGDRTIRVEHLATGAPSVRVTPPDRRTTAQILPLCVLNPQFSIDPYPLYRQLREINPVQRDPVIGTWIVTGYPEVVSVLRDRRFSSAPRSNRTRSGTIELDRLPAGPVRRDLAVMASVVSEQVVFLDAPAHTRVRARLGEVLSIPAAEAIRPRIDQIADELIDDAKRTGRMDLVTDFATLLPLRVVSDLLGFAREDEHHLKRWSDLFAEMLAFNMTLKQDLAARRTMIEMRGHFDRVIRNSPLARLMTGPDAITREEMFANICFLLAAGHDTTTSTLTSGIRALLDHPAQMQRLRDDPSLIGNAVEEMLRFESPVQWTGRRATEDVELAGQKIARNDAILISLGAANHDPRQFPDPDRFDITRPGAAKHLAFSGGAHYCLGATLGRIELHVGVQKLLQLRNLRVEPQGELRWRMGSALRGLLSLPVAFDPA